MNTLKLIPKNQLGNILNIDWNKLREKANQYFQNNINKINQNTPTQLKASTKSKRPRFIANMSNIRNVDTIKNGAKLCK